MNRAFRGKVCEGRKEGDWTGLGFLQQRGGCATLEKRKTEYGKEKAVDILKKRGEDPVFFFKHKSTLRDVICNSGDE